MSPSKPKKPKVPKEKKPKRLTKAERLGYKELLDAVVDEIKRKNK